jgi:hypothetical protein
VCACLCGDDIDDLPLGQGERIDDRIVFGSGERVDAKSRAEEDGEPY